MASSTCSWLAVLLVLATCVQCGLAKNIGSLQITNPEAQGSYTIKYQKTVQYTNNNVVNYPFVTLDPGLTIDMNMQDTIGCVGMNYTMVVPGSGTYSQTINSWCQEFPMRPMPDGRSCMPDCFWIVNGDGSYVSAVAGKPYQFFQNWTKL